MILDDPRKRHIAYYVTGCMILLCLLLAVVTGLLPRTEPAHPLLVLETVAIFSFGVSWFVKGTEPLPPIPPDTPAPPILAEAKPEPVP